MTAPDRTTWTVAPDPDTGDDTLWRGDTSLIRRSDLYRLMAQVDADGLFDLWVRVLAPDEATIERLAERVHDAYLETCQRLGWSVKPDNDVPYDLLSDAAQALDRGTVEAVLDALAGTSAEVSS